jgi:hypothetical protein
LEGRFKLVYPREYRIITSENSEFADYAAEVRKQLSTSLWVRGLAMERVIDQERITPCLMAFIRYLVVLAGGDDMQNEYEKALVEYNRQFEALCSAPIWADEDQDGAEDADEIDDHSAWQMLNSERGI